MNPLIDRFGRVHTYVRISVTDRCNLRCVYCMPAEGIDHVPRPEILTFEEISRVVRILAEMGVTKVRLTGGEPLLRKDLPDLVERIAATPGISTIALTTNGILLSRCAKTLRRVGVTHLNISLDTLKPERFETITLRDGAAATLRGIEAALEAGFAPLKLNAVIMGGVNDDEVLDFVEYVRDRPIHLRFIEFMPFSGNGWNEASLVPYQEIRRRIETRYTLVPLFDADGRMEISKDYTIPGWLGQVGFISSMSDDFCKDCDRLRLLTDGSLKSCLFHPPEENLRSALRSGAADDEIESLIRRCVSAKLEKHEPAENLIRLENNPMIAIGG